ncbi:PKD-like family lipoprotein [Pedobacter nutrimenti]|uniref:PKD-like family lipoprotein n=1 Tax=Pedobacter nutrimenti TaxID=1241337 RepID=UPI0029317B98|nr:PKD-like family lipoprotein [Pedobacter nutrimenti]
MKHKFKTGLTGIFLLLSVVIISCKKDTGNYSYNDINESAINGIDNAYTVLRGGKLSIMPKLSFTKDNSNDTSKYSYQWLSLDPQTIPAVSKVLATTRNLDWVISLASTNKPYTIYYTVTEKSTGVIWRKKFALQINTDISDGWVVLNEIDKGARLDYLNYDAKTDNFNYYKDVLASFSTLKLKGKPQMVYFYQRRDLYASTSPRSVLVGTDQNTFVINTDDNTFSKYTDIVNTMTNYYPPVYYARSVRCQGGNLSYMYDNLGQLFFENPTFAIVYSSPINKTITGETVNISPFYAEGYQQGIDSYALLYDVDKKRFMEHKEYGTSVSVPVVDDATPSAPSLFDPGHIDMELVYMASTTAVSAQTYALFKNTAGKLFLARISCDAYSFVPLAFDEITNASQMAGATQFAIDPQQGYLIYTVGSKIYRYNVFDKSNTMVLDYGSRKISLIKYQKMVYKPDNARYAGYATKLIVCTYEETNPDSSGKMDLYNVPNLNGNLSVYKSFDGMGKIIDVAYRE